MLIRILRRVFVNKNLFCLWGGQVISEAGDMVFRIGALWLVLEATGSEIKTGLVATATYLPVLLFGPLAGVAVDRWDRRRLMLIADAGRAVLVCIVPLMIWTGTVTAPRVAAVAFGLTCFSIFFVPARDAYLPALVPAQHLAHANGLIQTSWQLAMLVGPGLAALLVEAVGLLHLFSADSVSFLLSFFFVFALWPRADAADPSAATTSKKPGGWKSSFRDLKEGFSFVRKTPFMKGLLWITAVDNLFIMGPAIVGTPVFVMKVLGLGVREFAMVEACFATGVVIGIPMVTWLCRRTTLGWILCVGIVLDGLTYIPLLWVKTLPGTLVTILIHAAIIPMITIPRTTLVQSCVPAELRGRVFSLVSFTVIGFTALSAAMSGLLLAFIPANWLFAAIGLLAAATGGTAWILKDLRNVT